MDALKRRSVYMPLIFLFVTVLLCFSLQESVVYADTNGTEIKVADQPDKLVLELGVDWSGAEFELTLDSGVFPVPVVANDAGVLTMDIGGSKTYTLRLTTPIRAEPTPVQAEEQKNPNRPLSQLLHPQVNQLKKHQIRK